MPDRIRTTTADDITLLDRPWDVIRHLGRTIEADLTHARIIDAAVLNSAAHVMGDHPVEIHRSARVGPNVVFDAEHGPIIVDEGAAVRPGAILCGPCCVGCGSIVIDHAHIKPNTVIGPVCKIGGEVGATVFQGYANKSHDGHLGDSWIGEWVNFGAGTTNSNLLNTYGEVRVRGGPDQPRLRTGLTFLGAIVGDHVKFAILTRLMTGSIVGTGAMIASTAAAPATVAPFAWITDEGEQAYRFDKFIEVARGVMARRNVEPGEAYRNLLEQFHRSRGA